MCWFFPIVDNFPKFEKFVLCTQIKNLVLEISRIIIRANKSKSKKRFLYRIDVKNEKESAIEQVKYDYEAGNITIDEALSDLDAIVIDKNELRTNAGW